MDKLRVLSGRTVLLFPDADGYSEWKQRAESMSIFNICQAGDHFVCSSTIYGGTFNLFVHAFVVERGVTDSAVTSCTLSTIGTPPYHLSRL